IILGFGLTAFSQDSTNAFDYNYKKGMEHYNKGVDYVNHIKSNDKVLNEMSSDAKMEFKAAIPFLEKAYKLKSKDEKLLIALQGSYFSLQNFEKSDRYKKELEALKK